MQVGNLTKCQIPFEPNGVSGITQLLLLIALIWFTVHMVIRILGRIVK